MKARVRNLGNNQIERERESTRELILRSGYFLEDSGYGSGRNIIQFFFYRFQLELMPPKPDSKFEIKFDFPSDLNRKLNYPNRLVRFSLVLQFGLIFSDFYSPLSGGCINGSTMSISLSMLNVVGILESIQTTHLA